ncbi:MAG: acyltransferase [Deltaproteobacteria bacterium]|nr:acyltransferase [Deltaproteobacteria bacterium]
MPSRKLANDWYDGVIPDNVVFDDTNLIDTSYSFRRFRSRAKDALTLGRGAAIYANSGFDLGPDARVEIGDFAMINGAEIVCDESIRIGAYALISWNVLLMDNCRAPRSTAQRRAYVDEILRNNPRAGEFQTEPKAIVVGANVWIGHDCVVLPGVTIGQGSIVGARSVVVESVPEFVVAAGNPARMIRQLADAD